MAELPDCELTMRVLSRFREFLNDSWSSMDRVLEDHDWDNDAYFLADWLDANWELLVGRQLLGKGSGLLHFTASTNEVERKNYKFCLRSEVEPSMKFVTLGADRAGFSVSPPFDLAKLLGTDGVSITVPWSDLRLRVGLA